MKAKLLLASALLGLLSTSQVQAASCSANMVPEQRVGNWCNQASVLAFPTRVISLVRWAER
jgi:hypothetical protein